jgi:hypothetical protein
VNIDELIQSFKAFYAGNAELVIAIVITLAIAILIKPKAIGKILVGIGIIVVIGYVVSSLSHVVSKGVDSTNEVGAKTDKSYRDREQ